jgi:hypothetical protein
MSPSIVDENLTLIKYCIFRLRRNDRYEFILASYD